MPVFANVCRFNAVSAGLGSFVVASAAPGCKTPAQAFPVDGRVYHFHAQSADGLQFEDGSGAYSIGAASLARTTIFFSSNSDRSAVNFTLPPQVDVFPSPPPSLEIHVDPVIPVGTLMPFQQTSAPVGWTKQFTHNDKALRVVSGAASAGGIYPFSSMMSYRTTDYHTLTIAEMPFHNHSIDSWSSDVSSGNPPIVINGPYSAGEIIFGTGYQGGNVAHPHTITMEIQYVDLIIASKDLFIAP